MLGQLIERLKKEDPAKVVRHGFHNPHSYRGYYEDVAFEPAPNARVVDMLDSATSALGATFQGWKGGDFTMDEHTLVWLAFEGACGESIGGALLDRLLADSLATGSRIPPKLPIGVTPPVTVNCERDELTRIIYQGITSRLDWRVIETIDYALRASAQATADALLTGKSSAQLASEATDGQEGGDR